MELSIVLTGVWYFAVVPLLFLVLIPQVRSELSLNGIVAWSLMLGHLPYLVISLLASPVTGRRYSGILANPNQLGMVCVAVASGALILLVARDRRRRPIISLVLPGVALLLLVLLSGSRTSLVTLVAVAGVAAGLFWRGVRINLRNLVSFVFVLVLFVFPTIYLMYPQLVSLAEPVMNRFAVFFSGEAAHLSGREQIWTGTIREATLFGHGSDYFMSTYGRGAHNSLIAVLGEFGIPAAIFLGVSAVLGLVRAYLYAVGREEDPYSHGPLIILLGFWLMSMGEEMFGKLGQGITLAAFISTGLVLAPRVYERTRRMLLSGSGRMRRHMNN